MIKRIVFFLTILLLYSCSAVHFDNAMPIEASRIKSFNSSLTGNYYFSDSTLKLKDNIYYNARYFSNLNTTKDSLMLVLADVSITQKQVYYTGNLKFYYNINKIDTLRVILQHKGEKKTYENNFIIFELSFSDTLINLTQKDKLKFYKGKYYLNHCIEEYNWDIYQLEQKRDNMLSIGIINHEDEEKLYMYLINKNQILGNTAHLSDIEFYNFIERGGFRDKYKFKKY